MRIVFSLMLILSCLACSLAGPEGRPYSPPSTRNIPAKQRLEFINLFLRGRWTDASIVFRKSVDNFIQQDEFCAAAKNYFFLYNLFKYLSIDKMALLKKARSLAKLDSKCHPLLDITDDLLTEKDRKYKEVLAKYNFSLMISLLEKESDPLFKSVYARKAALIAKERQRSFEAENFLNLAYEIDKKYMWTLFLIEDLRLKCKFLTNKSEKEKIRKRIEILLEYTEIGKNDLFK
ncbi:hypothetical protein [Desulfovulcanus sp.]